MEEENRNQHVEGQNDTHAEMKPYDQTVNEEEQQQNESALNNHTQEPNQAEEGVPIVQPQQNEEVGKMAHEEGKGVHEEGGKGVHEQEVPDEMTYDAGSLKVIFKRRQFSLKITVMVLQGQQTLQDLLGGKKEECFSVVLTRANMPVFLRKHFKTPGNLHTFIVRNIKNQQVVTISKDEVRLVVAVGSEQARVSKIDIKALREQRYKFEIPNMDDMQDRLLQFSNEELEYIDKYYLISEGQEELSEADSQILQWLQYHIDGDDEEIFIEKWAPEAFQEDDDAIDMAEIQHQEKQFEEFEKKFPLFKKALQSYTTIQSPTTKNTEEKTSNPTNAFNPKDSVFPPGYVPPHLAKQTASDGLTSDQHLRFQSNQSKKEKLKIAKQLLKQGYSTAEVIQRLEAMEKSAKSSNAYVDPNPQPSQKALSKAPSAPSVVPPAQAKEKAVREMLISLIRAKTYKRLEDIHRHMMNEGLQTTMADLKRIIDEIKAKTAQRKAKEGKE